MYQFFLAAVLVFAAPGPRTQGPRVQGSKPRGTGWRRQAQGEPKGDSGMPKESQKKVQGKEQTQEGREADSVQLRNCVMQLTILRPKTGEAWTQLNVALYLEMQFQHCRSMCSKFEKLSPRAPKSNFQKLGGGYGQPSKKNWRMLSQRANQPLTTNHCLSKNCDNDYPRVTFESYGKVCNS